MEERNISIISKEYCTGCTACYATCSIGAISMIEDEEGFLYPSIDVAKCVNCGNCLHVCQVHSTPLFSDKSYGAYGIKHYINGVRENSSSGGAFTLLSDYVLNKGGVVYGAAYNDSLEVVHIRADSIKDRNRIRGAKYVQSKIGKVFTSIKNDLDNNLWVLFSGTPCQVAGLKMFLAKSEYDKLITCDIFCHSVPSPLIFKEHISYMERRRGLKAIGYSSREKRFGWTRHDCVYYENGVSDSNSMLSQTYYMMFNKGIITRPSCVHCQYAGSNRVGDFSIGDFWGAPQEIRDQLGVSALLVNTEKGNKIFEKCREACSIFKCTKEDVFRHNHKRPLKKNPNTVPFWNDYYNKGYLYVLKKHVGYSLFGKISFTFKKVYRAIMKRGRLS